MRYRRRCCIFLILVAFAAIGKDSLCFQRTESGLNTSPDPGLIYILNGMRLAAAVDALVIRDGGRTLNSGDSDRSGFCNFSCTNGMSVCSTD